MQRGFLALAVLLSGGAGLASADYLAIIANVGGGKPAKANGGGGAMGVLGMPGMPPGMPPGVPPGLPPGFNPGGGAGGFPPGGVFPPRGGPGMPQGGGGDATEGTPYTIMSIVEIEPSGNSVKLMLRKFEAGIPLRVRHHWGSGYIVKDTDYSKALFLHVDGKPLASVPIQYKDRFAEVMKEPSSEKLLELAEWTLTHGLVDRFPTVMDELAKIDANHPSAKAYSAVQAALKRAPEGDDAAAWRATLLQDYQVMPDPEHQYHYVALFNGAGNDRNEVKAHLDTLEKSFRGYYYWFALKKVVLPVPKKRLVVIMPSKDEDFSRFHRILTSGPVIVDGFFARRENVSVFSARTRDNDYDMLQKYMDPFKQKGFNFDDILAGKTKTGYPKALKVEPDGSIIMAAAHMLSMLRANIKQEVLLASVTHDASRQMLYASELLPRNVAAPEWILFGMGSFFETPRQSLWASMAAPSPYYLPRFKELKSKGFESTPAATLRKVVTDAYFRAARSTDSKDPALEKARASAWSLTYFLAQEERRLEGLLRYFKELSKLPRDVEVNEKVLMDCFARAFGLMDPTGKINEDALRTLANKWYADMGRLTLESDAYMAEASKLFKKELEASKPKPKPANGGFPGQFPGGFPGGNFPGGFPMPPNGGNPMPPNFPPNGGNPMPPNFPQPGRG